MSSLPLARSIVVALIGLTLALGVTAVLALASLYDSRQDYEDRLAQTFSAEVAVANLLAAGVVEEAVLRAGAGRTAQASAAAAYDEAADVALEAVQGDPESIELVEAQALAQGRARDARGAGRTRELRTGRRISGSVVGRQRERRAAARVQARDDSRRATITAGAAGALALLVALGLVVTLIGSVRRPLDALVRATRFLARGDVKVRVREEGPAELRELASSFNVMAGDLMQARDALEAERRRLATVVESLGDALIVAGPDGLVQSVNPRAGDLVPGLGPGGAIESEASPLPPLHDALAGEVQIEHRDRTLAVTAAHLSERPEDGVVWTVRDVSERARLERLKSEFVATASHELRSPLTSIKGFAELLLRTQGLGDRQREFTETIVLSTNRLVDLVNDLLDVTRMEAGRLELQRRPMQLSDVVDEVVQLMRPRFDDKQQQLVVEADDDVPAALGDPARMRQVVTNLLTNAHLYTPDQGTVRVTVSANTDTIALAVCDTGSGMTPEQISHVYDRFYRGQFDGGEKQPGTGLGLSIVKSLVDLHEGSIEIESEPGEGTTFCVRIPRAPVVADAATPRLVLAGKRVLVVEDEAQIAQLIAEQLSPHHVESVIVRSGEDALRRLRADPDGFDAITLDIKLSGISGFDVLHEVRRDPDLQRIPVVVVSVMSDRETLAGEWVVSKPIDEDELIDVLGSAILAGRSRVLVVGREQVRPQLSGALDSLGLSYDWAVDDAQAGELCERERYEVALVDAGLQSPQDVLERLDLRGRRLERTVVLFSAGDDAPGLAKLDSAPVPLEEATAAVLAALGAAQAR
jgi:signal transduction histidine kinase/HAMP domain-containing protein/DNA-binding NarL/FixJ family response regulator